MGNYLDRLLPNTVRKGSFKTTEISKLLTLE